MSSTIKYLIVSIIFILISFQFLILPWRYVLLSYFERQLLFLTGLGLISLLLASRNMLTIPRHIFTVFFIAFIGWLLASGLWAMNSSLMWPVFLAWVIFFMVFLISVSLPKDILNSSLFTTSILVIISLNVLEIYFVFFKTLVENDFNLSINFIEESVKLFNLNTNYIGSLFLLYVLILMAIPFIKWKKSLALVNIYMIGCLIPLFNSRAVSLVLTFLILFYGIHSFKNNYLKKYLVFLLVTLTSSFLLYQIAISNKSRFNEKYDPFRTSKVKSGDDRLKLWSNSLMLIKEKPLLGSGAGNWFIEIKKFGYNDYSGGTSYGQAHNLWVETTAELGIVGLLLIVALGFSGLVISLKLGNWHVLACVISLSILISFYGLYRPRGTYMSPYYIILFCWLGIVLRNYDKIKISIYYKCTYFLFVAFAIYLCISLIKFDNYADRLRKSNKSINTLGVLEWDNYYKPWLTTFKRGNSSLVIKSDYFWRLGLKEDAIDVLHIAIKEDPNDISTLFKLGSRYQSVMEWQKAGEYYMKILELHKDNSKTSLALTNLGLKSGNGLFFSTGVKLYYEQISPEFNTNYFDEYLLSENKRVSNFWKKRCREIDTYQRYLDKWQLKRAKLKK